MTVQIDTTAENNAVRFVQQVSHPSAPSSGHELLYFISGSPHGGMFVQDSGGRLIGPFITGSPNAGGAPTDGYYVLTSGTGGTLPNSRVIPYLANYNVNIPPASSDSNNDEFDDDAIAAQWSQIGSPDTISESTYHGFLWWEDNDSTPCGVRKAYAPGANALTVVIKLSGYIAVGFGNIVLSLETSAPANIAGFGIQNNNAGVLRTRNIAAALSGGETNTTLTGSAAVPTATYYLMIQRDNSTNYVFKVSTDGKNWVTIVSFSQAGTIANVSILLDSQGGGSTNSSFAVDFIRFFTSQTNIVGTAP